MTFVENHDTNPSIPLRNDFKKYQIAMAILATVGPQLYYGSEIAWMGTKTKRRCRHPKFSGGWEGDSNNAFSQSGTVEQQKY